MLGTFCRRIFSKTIETIEIKTWEDLLKQEEDLRVNEWLFRGMPCAGWKLKTSLERACENYYENCHGGHLSKAAHLEYVLYREFRRRYHNHRVGIPDPVGIEWLSLMQHYGAPTRLLDFTYSFFIATYFAVEKPCEESCCHAIWAVRSKWVEEEGIKLLKCGRKDTGYLDNKQNEREWELQKSFFESLLNLEEHDLEKRTEHSQRDPLCVFPINAMKLNDRSTIQQGVFLCAGNVTRPFEENLKNLHGFDKRKNLVKLVIPHKLRIDVLRKLHSMNINKATLFPGLQGFAESLGIYHPLAFGS